MPSSFFADIFKNNCLNIGVLPVQVSPNFLDKIFEIVFKNPETNLVVDLKKQTVEIEGTSQTESFNINGYKKNNLLNGYDDIDYLLNIKDSIQTFSTKTPL